MGTSTQIQLAWRRCGDMEIRKCEKGHYFDSEVNSGCPYCTGERKTSAGTEQFYPHSWIDAGKRALVTIYAGPPPTRTGKRVPVTIYAGPSPIRKEVQPASESKPIQCENGHIYDGCTNAECPYCKCKFESAFQIAFPDSRISEELPPPACVYAGPPVTDEKDKDKKERITLIERLRKRFK